ncbi:DUF1795 domain-containing protein, partial [Yersinia pseudotuberculosis]
QQATWEQWIHSFAPWAREAGHV